MLHPGGASVALGRHENASMAFSDKIEKISIKYI